MNSIQSQTKKIKKKRSGDARNFICGGCLKAYKFYPSLYLHFRAKHNGVRPPGTKVQKRIRPPEDVSPQMGRPKKLGQDIDDIPELEANLELIQNELMHLIGEKLAAASNLGPKSSLEVIVTKVVEVCQEYEDKWMKDLQEESKIFLINYKEKDLKMQTLDFSEEFSSLDPSKGLMVIVWFMIWLGKVHVKAEVIPDLCLVFSKVWKVMDETQLGAQDLVNKLVWKKIMKECEEILSRLTIFKNDLALLNEFIKKSCQLIGNSYEDESI